MNGPSIAITPKQKWIALCVGAALVVFLAGFFLLIKPRMDKPGEINSQKDGVQTQVTTQQQKLAALQAKASNLPKEKAIAGKVAQKFPATADQVNLNNQFRLAASQAGLSSSDYAVTYGVPVISVGNPSAGVSLPAGGSSSTPDSGSTATPAPGATGGASSAPAAASGQLATMSVSITVTAPPAKVQSFLKALENGERAILVNSVNYAGGGTNSSDAGSASISATMFLQPGLKESASATPSGVPAAPTPTPTPTS